MFFKPKMAPKDFQKAMLPQNRKQVFWDVVKLHWGKLFLLGLLAFAFSLPLHITALTQDFFALKLLSAGTSEELGQAVLQWISNSNTTALIEIPCLAVFAIGFAGLIRVVRQFAWEDNMFFRYDFVTGIRQNTAQMILLAVFVGFGRFVSNYILNLSLLITEGVVYSYLGIIPTVVLSILCIPAVAYATVCIAVYGNSFRQNIRIGFMLYARHPWKTLLAAVCGLLIFAFQCIPNFYTIVFGRVISSVLVPFIMLGWVLFTFDALDEHINPQFHPELIGKGTFPENNNSKSSKGG